MLKREVRQRKVAEWLGHLQGWKASGESLAAYARRCGLPLWAAAYHWRAVLTGEGSWREKRTSQWRLALRREARGAFRYALHAWR